MKKYVILLAICTVMLLLANIILAIVHFHISYVFGAVGMLCLLGLLRIAYKLF